MKLRISRVINSSVRPAGSRPRTQSRFLMAIRGVASSKPSGRRREKCCDQPMGRYTIGRGRCSARQSSQYRSSMDDPLHELSTAGGSEPSCGGYAAGRMRYFLELLQVKRQRSR